MPESVEQAALTVAALLIVVTMCLHSILGERRLLRPLLELDGIMRRPLARFIVPFAWHLTSLIGLILASILLAWAWAPGSAQIIGIAMTAAVFTGVGLWDAVGSRGQHVGWPPLLLTGLAALAALFFR